MPYRVGGRASGAQEASSKPGRGRVSSKHGRLLLVLGAVALVLAVLVGWFAGKAVGGQEPSGATAEAGQPDGTEPTMEDGEFDSPSDSSEPDSYGLDSFSVQHGADITEDQYPVGFSDSPEGGVSMVVVYLRWKSTNSAESLAELMNTYHDLESEATREMVEEEVLDRRSEDISRIANREGMFFNTDLFPMPGEVFEITPVGVTWWSTGEDTVDMFVLADEGFDISLGTRYTRRYIYGFTIQWNPSVRGGDWLVISQDDPSRDPDYRPAEEEYHLDHEYWTPIAGVTPYDYPTHSDPPRY